MTLFGVRLVGVNGATFHKLVITVGFIAAILLVRWVVVQILRLFTGKEPNERVIFWTRQASGLFTAVLSFLVIVSVWFDDPARLATGCRPVQRGTRFRTSESDYVLCRLRRHHARKKFQRRRSDRHGRGSRRRNRFGIYPDANHGNGTAPDDFIRNASGDVGTGAAIHRPDRDCE